MTFRRELVSRELTKLIYRCRMEVMSYKTYLSLEREQAIEWRAIVWVILKVCLTALVWMSPRLIFTDEC